MHVTEASTGTDSACGRIRLWQMRPENPPPPRIANLLLRLPGSRRECCFCGMLLFNIGVFVELEPFLLRRKRNWDGRVSSWLTCGVKAHLRGKGSGRGLRGLLGVAGGSRRLLRDWLLCTCLSTLLFRSSKVVMIPHCRRTNKISPVGGKYASFNQHPTHTHTTPSP